MRASVGKGTSLIDTGLDATNNEKEAPAHKAETAYAKRNVEEKPQVSEEIVIEEISIDGMCGVY